VKELQTESLEAIAELVIDLEEKLEARDSRIEALEQQVQDYGGEV
jgi:hypothetical protein